MTNRQRASVDAHEITITVGNIERVVALDEEFGRRTAEMLIGDTFYGVALDEEGEVVVSVDRVWAGKGYWSGTRIENCDADLGEDVYQIFDKALSLMDPDREWVRAE